MRRTPLKLRSSQELVLLIIPCAKEQAKNNDAASNVRFNSTKKIKKVRGFEPNAFSVPLKNTRRLRECATKPH